VGGGKTVKRISSKQASRLVDELKELNTSLYKLALKTGAAYPGCDAGTRFSDDKCAHDGPARHLVSALDVAYANIEMAVFQAEYLVKLAEKEERA
jgi:hypothetical protein